MSDQRAWRGKTVIAEWESQDFKGGTLRLPSSGYSLKHSHKHLCEGTLWIESKVTNLLILR